MDVSAVIVDQIRQSFIASETYLEVLDGEYPLDCKCPMCGKTHRVTMFWTGRGVPRKYCPQCKRGSEVTQSASVFSTLKDSKNGLRTAISE